MLGGDGNGFGVEMGRKAWELAVDEKGAPGANKRSIRA